jgi:hypothetical protein
MIIYKTGGATNPKIVCSSGTPSLYQEALRIVVAMPLQSRANRMLAAEVYYPLPVTFRLAD